MDRNQGPPDLPRPRRSNSGPSRPNANDPPPPADPEATRPMPTGPREPRRATPGRNEPPPATPRRDPLDDPHPAPSQLGHVAGGAPPATGRGRAAATPGPCNAPTQRHPARASSAYPLPRPSPTQRGQDVTAGRPAPRPVAARPLRRGFRQRPLLWVPTLLGVLVLVGLCAWLVPLLSQVQKLSTDIFVTPGPRPGGTPGAGVFPNWDKKERVNVLLLGLDTRTPGDTRSDTMILVSIDPANKTVSMMSIPRDLWVSIPGFGENRINAAYQFGETNGVPGGGPGLAQATVEQDLGVPVHYFAQIDFQGFQRVVDALDGITVDVPRPLLDNEYPAEDYAFMRIYIPGGLQHMDGRTALEYVRSRHADSDLSRNQRQQAVLLAIKQKGLQIGVVGKLNNILSQLQGAIKTDLSLTQAGSLGQLAQQIPPENIHSYAITADMTSSQLVDGQDVLIPDWDKIHAAVRQMLADPRLQNENARILVLNGTNTAGLANRTSVRLSNAGFTIADVAQAPDPGQHPRTQIVDYTGGQKPFTVQQLRAALNLSADQVVAGQAADRPANVDLVLTMGDDQAGQ